MLTLTAPSGAKIDVTISDYETCLGLFKSVLKAIRQSGIKNALPDNISGISDLMKMEVKELGGFMDAIVDVITSPEVEDWIFKCLERCTYQDKKGVQKINRSLFEDVSIRGDFIWIAVAVGRENIPPFLSHLDSGLKTIFQGTTGSQKSR
jgi:hypothetical protein